MTDVRCSPTSTQTGGCRWGSGCRETRSRRGCEWVEDEDGVWATACKQDFVLNAGTPAENGMRFCCYCGRPLLAHPWADMPGDDDAAEMGREGGAWVG